MQAQSAAERVHISTSVAMSRPSLAASLKRDMKAAMRALKQCQQAEAFVKQRIQHHDSSHDWWHIHRVRNMALKLAAAENLSAEERHLAELAALVHDVADHKYSGRAWRQAPWQNIAALSAPVLICRCRLSVCRINFSIPLLSSTSPLEDRRQLAIFLADQLGLTQQEQEVVLYVTDNVGFKEGLPSICAANEKDSNAPGSNALNNSGAAGSDGAEAALQQRVLAVVQDSDRLDAIGAIGIARCLTFGGSFNRVLHDPAILPRTHLTQQQYTDKAAQQTTLNHFHEKLFKLKDLMRTAAGRAVAESRHKYMQEFVERFHAEWEAAQ
ncbi:hypothetical protein ACK3TF_000834 [Chlorella vulgaris]